jgi:hypothetical protein
MPTLIPALTQPQGLPPGWQIEPSSSSRPWWQQLLSATAQFAVNGLANTLNASNFDNPYAQSQVRINPLLIGVLGFALYYLLKK